MKKDNTLAIPGVEWDKEGLMHEKRSRELSADALWSKVKKEAFVNPQTRLITFEPKAFNDLAKLIFDTAYRIGLTEKRKLDDWNARMTP